jgi:TonB family protein
MRRVAWITCLFCLGLNLSWSQSPDAKPDAAKDQSSSENQNSPSASGSSPDASTAGDSTKLEPIDRPKPIYPPEARQQGIQGQVLMKVVVSETGDVDSVEVISGDPALTQAAVDAVKQWKFKPFIKNGKPVKAFAKIPVNFALPPPGGVVAPVEMGRVSQGRLIHRVEPDYPEIAKMNHIQGAVVLQALITKDGLVTNLTPLSGPSVLFPASIAAVKQWRYEPYILNGDPVEVKTTITVIFQLKSPG